MPWTTPAPIENSWDKKEIFIFLRELFNRGKTFASFTWDAPSVGANTTVDTTLTTSTVPELKGLRAGQAVYVSPPATLNTGLVCGGAWAPADDQLTIRLGNVTAAPLNPASGTWTFQGVIV
jgi:hypothetical protein